jgi:TolA-binding protein
MAAFDGGDFGQAEQRLLAFEREHPADARVEDALFLRAVARARRGDAEGAAVLARAYLARYPGGFHRAEAERLIP